MYRKLKIGQRFAEKYTLVERLGVGGFAEVWKVKRDSGFIQALKIFSGLSEADTLIARKEFEKIFNLNHPSILTPSDWGVYEQHPFLVLRYCEHGNALSLAGRIKEQELIKLIFEISSGPVSYTHLTLPTKA